MSEDGTPAMLALGDMVQDACLNSDEDVIAFVILGANGNIEYRSPLDIATLKQKLFRAAEAL